MRHAYVVTLLAIGAVTSSCAPSQRPDDVAEENAVETAEPLTKVDTMGSFVGWSAEAGPTTDPALEHEIDSVSNKDAVVEMQAIWPQFEGSYTTTRENNCRASYAEMFLYKRANSGQSWTYFGNYVWDATPFFNQSPNPTTITSCRVDFELSDAIHFVSSDQLLVHVISHGGDGTSGVEDDIVRRVPFNECVSAGNYMTTCLGGTPGQPTSTPCAGRDLCVARCIETASCAVIADAASGKPTDVSKVFLDCTTHCAINYPTQ